MKIVRLLNERKNVWVQCANKKKTNYQSNRSIASQKNGVDHTTFILQQSSDHCDYGTHVLESMVVDINRYWMHGSISTFDITLS